jgi:hypothetical protein
MYFFLYFKQRSGGKMQGRLINAPESCQAKELRDKTYLNAQLFFIEYFFP